MTLNYAGAPLGHSHFDFGFIAHATNATLALTLDPRCVSETKSGLSTVADTAQTGIIAMRGLT